MNEAMELAYDKMGRVEPLMMLVLYSRTLTVLEFHRFKQRHVSAYDVLAVDGSINTVLGVASKVLQQL